MKIFVIYIKNRKIYYFFSLIHQEILPFKNISFELLGIDILIDEKLNCWVMEMNISPAMDAINSKLDFEIKSQISSEMFNLINIINTNPLNPLIKIENYNNLYQKIYLENSKKNISEIINNPSFIDLVNIRDYLEEKFKLKFFKKIFPKKNNIYFYNKIIDQKDFIDLSFFYWINLNKFERKNFIDLRKFQFLEGLIKKKP